MVIFGCDWCKQNKTEGETWILGLAAESIGITAARREVTILPTWNDGQACHPLAVHFCSVEHKDNYMAALFETQPMSVETVVRTKASGNKRIVEREYVRTSSSGPIAASFKERRAPGKKGKAA